MKLIDINNFIPKLLCKFHIEDKYREYWLHIPIVGYRYKLALHTLLGIRSRIRVILNMVYK